MLPTDLRSPESTASRPTPIDGFGQLVLAAAGARDYTSGDMATAQALVVFAFGAGVGHRVGRTNEQLAAVADDWPDLPILAQSEVAMTLARRGRTVIDIESDLRDQRGLCPASYVDTSMVAEAAAAMLKAAGWSRVAVVSHPAHTPRCAASMIRQGIEPIVPDLRSKSIDFDPGSTQWWTRNRGFWLARESAVIAHHKILRKL